MTTEFDRGSHGSDDRGGIDRDPERGTSAVYRAAWVTYLLLALGGVVWLGVERDGPITLDLFISPSGWAFDALIGLAAGGGLLLLWRALATLPSGARLESQIAQLLGPLAPGEALALAVVSGVAEEFFFRGAMQTAWGWGWATLIFGLLHTGPGRDFRLWTFFALLAGGVFAWLTIWRGTLMPAILAHVLVNAVNLRRLTAAA
ncbi:MAG: type II CAAX endopeptidase family protein [Acidobacteriota bacterium]